MANKTLWVQAQPSVRRNGETEDISRKVVLSEADPAHPTPTGEIWIVAYEDPRYDADGNEVKPANPPIEVGDTPLVRQRIAEKALIQVDAPAKPAAKAKTKENPPPDPNANQQGNPDDKSGETK